MDAKTKQDPTKLMWRVGRKVGRTIYAQLGETPSDNDPLIGVLDTRELALEAVKAHNFKSFKTKEF
jgi:hypothetical protein